MDKHYLAPLLAPQAVAVFAGNPEAPESQAPAGRTLAAALKAQSFTGTLQFLDIRTSGTLATPKAKRWALFGRNARLKCHISGVIWRHTAPATASARRV